MHDIWLCADLVTHCRRRRYAVMNGIRPCADLVTSEQPSPLGWLARHQTKPNKNSKLFLEPLCPFVTLSKHGS